MTQHTMHLVPGRRTVSKHIRFHDGLRRHIDSLVDEREQLREEVRQLSASLQIYAEIVRRLQAVAKPPLRAA